MTAAKKTPKVLVANRSEIACRIFQACRELGWPSVALVAPGDEKSRHVAMADEVLEVPGYLDAETIVAGARERGVSLVHPGYGFLSERAHFVKKVEAAGMTFVGPTAESMEALGEKIASKELAERAGVPTLPWAKVGSTEELKKAAAKIGYPLLLKASAGGGGKGMRKVSRAEELLEMAESASSEAKAAFGEGTLFLEKLVEHPRHIEVQVFGDGKGGGFHLFERECSLQRRHQKVWEEATAPHLREETRQGLFAAALRLVKEVKYRSAGTLEFLVDASENFYFLEMNTRLQVEHPVTELVSGVDLVHAQLKLAAGVDLTAFWSAGATLIPRGHAIEVRLYAEDPAMGYAPTPGMIDRLRWPTGPGIRIDSGIEEGQELGTQFDAMIAKVIVYGENRSHAIQRMRYALEETVVLGSRGFGTNQAFLRYLCDFPEVVDGRVTTSTLGALAERGAEWAVPAEALHGLLSDFLKQSPAAAAGVQASSAGKAFPSPWFAKGATS